MNKYLLSAPDCPKCGSSRVKVVRVLYIEGQHYTRRLFCRACHHEWRITLILKGR